MTNNETIARPAATQSRPNLLEGLETRRLMAGYSANINFQPGNAKTPSGYTADLGQSFGWKNGKQYGWNAKNSGMVVRTTSADDLHDTYAKVATSGNASTWEIAVPNGTYSVKITAGDASAYDSRYAFKVEGQTVLDKTPTSASRWAEGTANVVVKDGRLTLQTAAGASNAKIDAITLKQTSASTTPVTTGASVAPNAPVDVGADATSSKTIDVTWTDTSSNETNFIVQRSTDGSNFADVATLTSGTSSWTNSGLNASTKYYYRVKAVNSYGTTVSGTASCTTDPTSGTVSAPSAPTNLKATAKSSTSASLSWSGVSNETGYIIQQSTDGSNFSEVGRVGVDNGTYTLNNLTAGKKYYWRAVAYNAGGNSGASNTVSLTMAASTPTDGGNGGGGGGGGTTVSNTDALSGVSVNTNNSASSLSPAMNALGIKNVRVWYSVSSWTANPSSWYIDRAAAYKAQGYKVMLAVVTPNVPTYAQAKAFFQRLSAYPGIKNIVDYWEINNEPNWSTFWKGTAKQYVDQNLKPAYEVLHAQGETVVGAAPTWDAKYCATLTSLGYTNYCDYANFHPYGESGATVVQRAAAAKAAYGNKPMMISEWNVQGMNSNPTKWANENKIAGAGLSKIATISYYFALMHFNDGYVGEGGLLNSASSHNSLFYDAYYDLMH